MIILIDTEEAFENIHHSLTGDFKIEELQWLLRDNYPRVFRLSVLPLRGDTDYPSFQNVHVAKGLGRL